MTNIKAIETWFDGIKYRSRTEARWAKFWKELGRKAVYEKEGFDLEFDGKVIKYLPDFYLPDFDIFLEIKGKDPNEDEMEKCFRLADGSGKDVLLAIGQPDDEPQVCFFYGKNGLFHKEKGCERLPNVLSELANRKNERRTLTTQFDQNGNGIWLTNRFIKYKNDKGQREDGKMWTNALKLTEKGLVCAFCYPVNVWDCDNFVKKAVYAARNHRFEEYRELKKEVVEEQKKGDRDNPEWSDLPVLAEIARSTLSNVGHFLDTLYRKENFAIYPVFNYADEHGVQLELTIKRSDENEYEPALIDWLSDAYSLPQEIEEVMRKYYDCKFASVLIDFETIEEDFKSNPDLLLEFRRALTFKNDNGEHQILDYILKDNVSVESFYDERVEKAKVHLTTDSEENEKWLYKYIDLFEDISNHFYSWPPHLHVSVSCNPFLNQIV